MTTQDHTDNSKTPAERFAYFIKERHSIYLRRQQKQPAPWTDDPILAQYRFCNIYRQLDRVTIWLNGNWYPAIDPKHMVFMACVARVFNHPDPLTVLRPVLRGGLSWSPDAVKHVLKKHQNHGGIVRGNAYIVSTNGRSVPFVDYIVDEVLSPIREALRIPRKNILLLSDFAEWLQQFQGMGSFMAGQVIADLKHATSKFDQHAVRDWWTFVVPGPGSKRGLNRLLGRPHNQAMSDKIFHDQFRVANFITDTVTGDNDWEAMCAQDVQNCLCEFDKYERARLGQGRPKQNYVHQNKELF